MADSTKPKTPPQAVTDVPAAKPTAATEPEESPFAGKEDDWENELAAWDASLPIQDPALMAGSATSSTATTAVVAAATLAPAPAAAPEPAPGAIPEEENPFSDTPTTVVSALPVGLDLEDLTEAVEPEEEEEDAAMEFVADFAPTSSPSSPHPTVSPSVDSAENLFDSPPPAEPAKPMVAEGLPEMASSPWQEALENIVTVPVRGAKAGPPDGDWRTVSTLYLDEAARADTPPRRAALTMSAARAAEMGRNATVALALYDRALHVAPGSAPALRGRLRLLEAAAGRPDHENAPAALVETLGRLAAAVDGEERAFYRALEAEWTLATTGKLDRATATLLGDGLGRTLAEAEMALRQDRAADAAAALDRAARSVGEGSEAGGTVAGALAAAAARLYEVAGDFAAAAGEHLLAERFDRGQLPVVFGRLRDASRAGASAEASLGSLLLFFPASDLKVSLARWAAALARAAGAPDRAARMLADPALGPGSRALLRDRIDLAADRPAPEALDLFLRGAEAWPAPEARAGIDLLLFERAADAPDGHEALKVLERGLAAAPDAVPLALAAERLARTAGDAAVRKEALRLWRLHDPARAAHAWSLLVDALAADDAAVGGIGEAAGAEGGAHADADADPEGKVREALRGFAAEVPGAVAFWRLAARERRKGRRNEAAAALEAGAQSWRASALSRALAEIAASLRADPAPPSSAPLPEREDRRSRPFAGLRAASNVAERRALAEIALGSAPDDPAALALLALDAASEPKRLAEIYQAAGAATAGELWTLQAIHALGRAGDGARARALAAELHARQPGSAAVRQVARRLAASAPDAAERAHAMARLGFDPGDPAELLSSAEALEQSPEATDHKRAETLFRQLEEGPLGIEARRGLARLQGDGGREDSGAPADEAEARVRGFLTAAAAGDTAALIKRLEREPPHEDGATAASLYLGALLAEGRSAVTGAAEAARLTQAAMRFLDDPTPAHRPGLLCAWRAADDLAQREPASRARAAALAAVAARLAEGAGDGAGAAAVDGNAGDDSFDENAPTDVGPGTEMRAQVAGRAAATVLVRAAEVDAAAGAGAAAEERLRLAIEHDGACLPALTALRRALARRGAMGDAAKVCEQEAAAVSRDDTRIRLLLMAANLARAVDRRGDAPPATRATRLARAAGPLRKVLAIDPGNVEAFEQLRAIFAETGEHAKLAEVLAGRIAVASNPFEIASLRMARAELLAGPLGSHVAARAELTAILQKEPQHARALTRLSDLCYEDGAYAEAAEAYVARALVERSPELLREIFLRIGRIYTRHVHDAKRAADAWRRVLQLETNNREALSALSDLLVELGDAKGAAAVTERLVEHEPDVEKRVPSLIRLGQLWEQSGDLRRAGARFRQAADTAPRNVHAVGEMVRYFERTRDPQGRRALLDNALLLLRGDLQAGKLDLPMLRALVSVQQWRGRPAAAGAGAQLLAGLPSDGAAAGAEREAPPPHARPLGPLGRAEIDERLYPPGVPSGVRNIFRLIGEPLSKGPADLKRYELGRGDAIARGQSPRDIIDAVAAEAGVRALDVHVKPARTAAAAPPLMIVEPGDPPALILGEAIVKLGPAAVRFAAARAARLVAAHLDQVVRGTPEEAGALVGGLVRQFVPDYRHPEVPSALLAARAESMARLLPRRLKQEVMPFAIEVASGFELGTLHAAVRDGANRVGLLASGDLGAALSAILAAAGRTLTLPDLLASPEARALIDFALSDAYDDLLRDWD